VQQVVASSAATMAVSGLTSVLRGSGAVAVAIRVVVAPGAEVITLGVVRIDLAKNLDDADRVYNGICSLIDDYIARNDIDAPPASHYEPIWQPQEIVATLDPVKAGISTIIWTTGFRSDRSWVELPIFDGVGYPTHLRGATSMAGIYVLGLPWLYMWGRFVDVGRDAEFVSKRVAAGFMVSPATGSSVRSVLELAENATW
jgi:putative flavoprotein involved in K+ transport